MVNPIRGYGAAQHKVLPTFFLDLPGHAAQKICITSAFRSVQPEAIPDALALKRIRLEQHLEHSNTAEANLSCALSLMVLPFNHELFGTSTSER